MARRCRSRMVLFCPRSLLRSSQRIDGQSCKTGVPDEYRVLAEADRRDEIVSWRWALAGSSDTFWVVLNYVEASDSCLECWSLMSLTSALFVANVFAVPEVTMF